MSRKRQRSRATLTDDEEQPVVDVSDDEQQRKEVDVWDAFKEEHYEVLEQLPLSLHRQFKLMHELDAQGEALQADLLASVRRYICLREHLNQVESNTNPVAHPPRPGETTRTLLQHVAQTSEEAIRAAEEKVSIAQTAYETVDRHIRLLDQAIKEQEAAISLGVRPGTHLAPILLPDLVVPRWARPSRVEHSPVPSLSPEPELYVQEPPVPELVPPPLLPPHASPKAPKKGKKTSAPKPTEEVHPSAAAVVEEPGVRTRRTSVRLTLPAPPPSQPVVPGVPADPNEKRYCYCHQVSFGTMIACDGEGCRLEWFHIECTGLSDVPSKKTKWYCRECKPKMTQRGRSRM